MAGLLDVFIMKDRMNHSEKPIFIILEKASILITLLVIVGLGMAMNLPYWGVALMFGLSLGPVVFGHYYFLYIRPILKQQQAKIEE
ncbi:MAG: hypothetical protein CMA63_05505 [Euryarchaeota archaeon]|nr:hypothetical protein [Euryarchaeota archaeon]|tara:strand:- start:10463 stop:10720 length:258 start_codon:yes stop_codon:yes gene_type:complete